MAETTESVTINPSTDDIIYNHLPVQDVTSMVMKTTSLVVIGLLAILGNSLVLSGAMNNKKLRTPSNVFICNLSLAGIVIGALLFCITANLIENR